MIKFWSYKKEYTKYKKNLLKIINKSMKSGVIFFGKELEKFEKNFIKKFQTYFYYLY